MFILWTKLLKTNNLSINIWVLPSYGLYRWKKFNELITLSISKKKGYVKKSTLFLTKLFLTKLLSNPELDKSLPEINKKIKQSICSYAGLRHLLNLPVWGQWTKTNASTQRILAKQIWKWHFIQKWNWWKFINKEAKKNEKKNSDDKKN